MPDPKTPDLTIDTMPTKELFIDMLTKDIALSPAILDLVDNCADGAKRLHGEGPYKDLWVRIETSSSSFRIADNCGGIPVDVARKYAFRFGRPAAAPTVKHSVGQFGVGMKRAIFKMGRAFRVESATKSSRFVIEVDVEQWAADRKWEFEFSHLEETVRVPRDEQGTTIEISNLNDDVSESFGLRTFETELKNAIESRLQHPISRGLAVTLNKIPVTAEPLEMLSDPRIAPAYLELKYPEEKKKPVTVKLYCGLGLSEDPEAAGWHVFCNGRLILEGDKSDATGWGWTEDGLKIPGFHGQFNYLRGYAYFDCDDAGRLPWNTTKTGVDIDSAIYRAVRLQMMKLMRPVVDFCNRLKEEKERRGEDPGLGPLEQLVETSDTKTLPKISVRDVFTLPVVRPVRKGPTMQRIQYDRPLTKVNKVKQALAARSFKEVGEKTFDYFYNAEVVE